ncbi:MAG: hypothetical protein ABWY23_00220 [Mycetocola sp.]
MRRGISTVAPILLVVFVLAACAPLLADTPAPSNVPTECADSAATPGPDTEWPPPDTCGEFLPAPALLYLPLEFPGCGGTVLVMGGDSRTLEYKATVRDDGSTLVEYRGSYTLDIARDYGGGLDAFVDELDVSGRGYDLHSRDGVTVTYSREGPAVFASLDAAEAQVFAEEGFPALFFFESGTVTEKVVFTGSDAQAVDEAEFTENTVNGVQSVCYLLDPANPGE